MCDVLSFTASLVSPPTLILIMRWKNVMKNLIIISSIKCIE